MAYELDQFISDCRSILSRDPGPDGREQVRTRLEQLLQNPDFVRKHCEDAPRGLHVLYEDPKLGFQILAHINDKARVSPPHDHGASWAIYGQATHYTDMIEWEREDNGGDRGARQAQAGEEIPSDARQGRHLPGRQDSFDRLSRSFPLHSRDRDQSRSNQSRALRPENRRSAPNDAATGDVTSSGERISG